MRDREVDFFDSILKEKANDDEVLDGRGDAVKVGEDRVGLKFIIRLEGNISRGLQVEGVGVETIPSFPLEYVEYDWEFEGEAAEENERLEDLREEKFVASYVHKALITETSDAFLMKKQTKRRQRPVQWINRAKYRLH